MTSPNHPPIIYCILVHTFTVRRQYIAVFGRPQKKKERVAYIDLIVMTAKIMRGGDERQLVSAVITQAEWGALQVQRKRTNQTQISLLMAPP